MPSLNILFLTAHLPVLGLHGGGIRMFHNLKALSQKHKVSLISFIESENEKEGVSRLEDLGVQVKTLLRRPSKARHLFIPKPREHDEYHSQEIATLVRETLGRMRFDVIQAEFIQMGQHVPRSRPLLKILTEHEIQFANSHAAFRAETRPLWKAKKSYDWMVQLNYEVGICRRFDWVVCMTDQDKAVLSEFVSPTFLRTIPIGVDSDYFQPNVRLLGISDAPRLLFVGNYRHTPNREAVYHFAKEILPRIHQVLPRAEFWVVGANAHLLDRQALTETDRIQVVGYVKDIRTAYQEAQVFVAPIQSGNGMRVKLLEALSMGMAVVASPLASSGFCTTDEEYLLLANNPDEFAAQTLRLLDDPLLCDRVGTNARRAIKTHYDWKVIETQFLELVESRHA
jgi:glycosyltransferase involved in cell wall biosynthesis